MRRERTAGEVKMIKLDIERIKELEKEYGLPLYLFNRDEFIQNYRELENTFCAVYPKYRICYSYKTNYTPAICRLVKEMGGYAEVVSDMEYELAVRLGYTAGQIVYNGPMKGQRLEKHILEGGINNLDRMEEVMRLCSLAGKYPDRKLQTGIRVNFDIDAGYISRFGFDTHDVGHVIQILRENNIRVSGLHCHMSRARGIAAWNKRVLTMLSLVRGYGLDDLDYISLGSGMSGKMDPELMAQFDSVATYEDYRDAVVKPFALFYADKGNHPELLTEPGTTVVSKYVDFIARVEGIKTVRGKQFVLCNCSFHNLGETCQMKNLPMRVMPQTECRERVKVTNADLVGYTCLEQDVLFRGYTGEISIGDYVEFGNVGGYSLVEKPPFIQPDCPMVELSEGAHRMIKRQENWSDIFNTFVI